MDNAVSYAQFKKLATEASIVTYASWRAVGYEAYANFDFTVYGCIITGDDVPDFDATFGTVAIKFTSGNDAFNEAVTNGRIVIEQSVKIPGAYSDPYVIRRFGQCLTTASIEMLLYPRIYVEPQSQAQRSVVSTSVNDSNPNGSNAKAIKLTYLNSNYDLRSEVVFLNGTTPVNTVATDIRFIESMEVVKGSDAAGAIKLMALTGGLGAELAAIGSATSQTFMCHHYVPSGSICSIISWNGVTSDDVNFKLKAQDRPVSGNLVERVIDLDNLSGIASGSRLEFGPRSILGTSISGSTYIRITITPQQNTQTQVRGTLYLSERKIIS